MCTCARAHLRTMMPPCPLVHRRSRRHTGCMSPQPARAHRSSGANPSAADLRGREINTGECRCNFRSIRIPIFLLSTKFKFLWKLFQCLPSRSHAWIKPLNFKGGRRDIFLPQTQHEHYSPLTGHALIRASRRVGCYLTFRRLRWHGTEGSVVLVVVNRSASAPAELRGRSPLVSTASVCVWHLI